jgi:hypothetical protein
MKNLTNIKVLLNILYDIIDNMNSENYLKLRILSMELKILNDDYYMELFNCIDIYLEHFEEQFKNNMFPP